MFMNSNEYKSEPPTPSNRERVNTNKHAYGLVPRTRLRCAAARQARLRCTTARHARTRITRSTLPDALFTLFASVAALLVLGLGGCGGTQAQKTNTNFFTSGSREADQRAAQKMAQNEQLTKSGEGAGEKGTKKARAAAAQGASASPGGTNAGVVAKGKTSLFERLGGEPGISNIVTDFAPRALDDPRVNWSRIGVRHGGLSIRAGESVAWDATKQNVGLLRKHLVEFLALATGGPAKYTGRQIEAVHADMHISNPEFDAVIGDLKASLDKLQVPNMEQKELLAIIESTRPQIVTKR